MPVLIIRDPQGIEQQLQLEVGEYVIGRDPDAAISLPSPKVSRRHARIYGRDAELWIEDLGSSNGVTIGGTKIQGPTQLSDGTAFEICGYAFEMRGEPDAPPASFSLYGLSGPVINRAYLLPLGDLTVGRSDDNDIPVPHPSISRQHAVIQVTATNVIVEDLGSSNGTFINDTQITRRLLRAGDRIKFGKILFEAGADSGTQGAQLFRMDRSMTMGLTLVAIIVLLVGIVAYVATRDPNRRPQSPQDSESVYERSIEQGLVTARASAYNQDWDAALSAYQRVLDRDPINDEARRGADNARQSRNYAAKLRATATALQAGRLEDALRLAMSISDDSYLGPRARAVALSLRQQLAEATLGRAQGLCKQRRWKDCYYASGTHLDYATDPEPGRALLQEAAAGMDKRQVKYLPWTPMAATTGEPSANSTRKRFPDACAREAAGVYAKGQIDKALAASGACKDKPGGGRLRAWLVALRDAKTEGDAAAMTGDKTRAMSSWQHVLMLDAKIVPRNEASAVRTELADKVAGDTFARGEAAFKNEKYAEAYRLWARGLSFTPQHVNSLAGMAQLEGRAQSLHDAAGEGKSVDGCARLAQVMAMTRPASTLHQSALSKRANCGSGGAR